MITCLRWMAVEKRECKYCYNQNDILIKNNKHEVYLHFLHKITRLFDEDGCVVLKDGKRR